MAKIEIINRALLKLGEPPVSSLNDAVLGKTYDVVYEDVRKLLLSSYSWRFAVKTKRLAQCAEKKGDNFVYRLPTDCLLLLKIFGTKNNDVLPVRSAMVNRYEVAGDCIVTTVGNGVEAEYVSAIDNDALFSPLFREAMAAKIAAELSMRVKHSLNIRQFLEEEFLNLIRQAEFNNEIIKDAELVPDNSWVLVRDVW